MAPYSCLNRSSCLTWSYLRSKVSSDEHDHHNLKLLSKLDGVSREDEEDKACFEMRSFDVATSAK